ncbi:MAG: glycosyltransferase family 39 protein, partial [Lentisphaeria bacterium]|nr:glycosyltransferase family 39 protein [Lentisphaeria bacterium]
MSNKTTQTTTANGSSTAAGRSGRTAERSAAGQAAPPPPLTPSAALAELMPGLSAEPADAGAPAAVSAAFVKPGRISFFNSAFAVFLVALICRFCFAWSGISDPEAARFFRPDSASYLAPALSLAETGEYRGTDGAVTAHRTPGFPAFLGVLMTFGVRPTSEAETIWISVFLLVLGALTVFPIYCACRYVASWTCSALAALLFALNPTVIAHAPLLLSDTFFTLIVAFILFFFISFALGVKKDPFYYFSAVFLAAMAALIRPINLLFFIPLIVSFLLIDHLSLKKKLIYSAVTCSIFFVVLFPWIARNHA